MNHTVTHEYGHQRAGLTDDEGADAALYHTGRLPTGRKDVMVGDEAEYRGHRDAVFDSNGNEQKGDHTTCHGNLVTNQSVH